MRTSFFTELMDSYVGIRKRTWKPAYVFEAEDADGDKLKGTGSAKLQSMVKQVAGGGPNGPPVLGGGPTENKLFRVFMGPKGDVRIAVPGKYQGNGTAVMKPNKTSGQLEPTDKFNSPSSQSMWGVYVSYLEGSDAKERRSDPPPSEGFGDGDEPDEEQSRKDAKKEDVKAQVQGTDVKFEQHHKDSIMAFLMSQGGGNLSKEEAEEKIAQMERQVNMPYSNTNIYYGMAMCLGSRPDFGPEVKTEVLAAVGDLYEAVSKIKTTTVDGQVVRAIHEGDLRGCMDQATRLTTVRGQSGDKGVFIGRGSEDFGEAACFGNLQDFVSEFDHQEYGSTFGRVMTQMAKNLMDVVVIPSGADMTTVTPEDIKNWRAGEEGGRLLTRRSISVERREGSDDLENHYKGLIQEDVFELIGASIAGDEAGKKAAMESLRKHLEAGAAMASEDLDALETVLLSDEFLLLQDLQKFEDLGIPPNETLRMIIQQSAVHAQAALLQLGLREADIIRMERPSKESKIGEKSDVDVVLEDTAMISPRWADAVYDRPVLGADGNPIIDPQTGDTIVERVLSISIKFYNSLNSDTVVGTCSLFKAYGLGAAITGNSPEAVEARAAGRAEADRLHDVCTDDLLRSGAITREQAQDMETALETDRAEWARLEKQIGSFTQVNNSQMKSYLSTALENPPAGLDKAGEAAYRKQIIGIQKSLEAGNKGSKNKGPDATAAQQAAEKLWQLNRIQAGQKDPAYAKASALNDMILSSQTYNPEIQMKGATGVLRLDNNRENLRATANALFSDNGRVTSTVTQSTIYGWNEEAGMEVPLFITSLRAKTVGTKGKRRKQIAEGKQTRHGAALTSWQSISKVGRQQPIPPIEPEEEPEESTSDLFRDASNDQETLKAESQEPEEEEVSNFQPVLDNLPAIETGEVKRMGDKMIAVLKPFCLKVKCRGEEYEGGFMNKEDAIKALSMVKQLAVEFEEKVDVKVKDYKWHRTFS